MSFAASVLVASGNPSDRNRLLQAVVGVAIQDFEHQIPATDATARGDGIEHVCGESRRLTAKLDACVGCSHSSDPDGFRQVFVESTQASEPGVVGLAVGELDEPRIADARCLRDHDVIPLAGHQRVAHTLVEWLAVHAPTLATFCYGSKQPIASGTRQIPCMPVSRVVETFAANLTHFMSAKGLTQAQVGAKSGLGQTTISLYTRPRARNGDTATGKLPSPTLANIEAVAEALGVEVWELLRPLTPAKRDLLKSLEAVIAEHVEPDPQGRRSGEIPATKRRRAS